MPFSLTETDSNARATGKGGEVNPCHESNEVIPNHGRGNAIEKGMQRLYPEIHQRCHHHPVLSQ